MDRDVAQAIRFIASDYYYRIPVRTIYKSYPVYAPTHEPPSYFDWLRQQDPVIVWDDKGHTPSLKTEADWISSGEIVFDAPIGYGGLFAGLPRQDLYVREPSFYEKTGTPVAADGTVPFCRYVVTKKGQVRIGILGCAMCHTRVMPDGKILKGAQGNFPFDRAMAYNYRNGGGTPEVARELESSSVPFLVSPGSAQTLRPASTRCQSTRSPPGMSRFPLGSWHDTGRIHFRRSKSRTSSV